MTPLAIAFAVLHLSGSATDLGIVFSARSTATPARDQGLILAHMLKLFPMINNGLP